jgi:hypothetical protein
MIVYKGTCIDKRVCPLYRNAKNQRVKIIKNIIHNHALI